MKTNTNMAENESGVVLIAVVCMTALAAILAAGLMNESGSQLKTCRRSVNMEQAFCVAEGGAERAVSYLQRVNSVSSATCLTGSIGNGNYLAFIVPSPSAGAGGSRTLSGQLDINPNNSSDNEFLLVTPDGTSITRDDLANDTTEYDSEPCVYYSGPASLIHVKPKGNGSQNSLIINGVVYTLNNSTTYDLVGDMNVVLQNDSRNNGNHRANGKWQLVSMNGDGVSLFDGSAAGSAGTEQFEIRSIGTVNNSRRTVILEGVRQDAWARFALWFDHSGGSIYFVGGEVMNGPVHSNMKIYLQDDPTFNAEVTSAATTWGQWSYQAVFNAGYQLGVPRDSMASVNFSNLLLNATLVITGSSSINLTGGTNVLVTNPQRGWVNNNYSLESNSLIYVKTFGGSIGTVNVGGTNLDGRLTIVADNHIQITNHIAYAVHPTNDSNDALGLVARSNVVVMTSAPNNLNIYAHIISCNTATNYSAGFYVSNYNSGYSRGALNVYGGMVENNRGAVGYGNAGYRKNYIYDTRFATDPPPHYPTVTNVYTWSNWRETP